MDGSGAGEGLEIIAMSGDERFAAMEKAVRTVKNVHITGRTSDSIAIQFKMMKVSGRCVCTRCFPVSFLVSMMSKQASFRVSTGRLYGGLKLSNRSPVKL
jgi:hypothetical protein